MKIYKRYFQGKKILFLILFFELVFIFSSCTKNNYPVDPSKYTFKSNNGSPDYSDLQYWAAHPWKQDPADKVPGDLKNDYKPDTLADVFFIHPTTQTDYADTTYNAAIDNAEINIKTDNSTILYQASVFNESCRVFAPRYRQAHIRCFFMQKEEAEKYFDIAYDDIKSAFEYYLSHYNNGRPIIIASHSQGTLHAGRLLKEFFEGKPLQDKLVCAYIIGMPVPSDYFSTLQPCMDSLATGCFVGWRIFKSGYTPEPVKEEKFKSIVVNPLTWTTSEEQAPASLNKGGVLKNFDKIVPEVVDAKIHGNILWTSKPDVFGKILLTNPNYHIGDINLFYMNIRENVKTRIHQYLKNHKPY